jgi:hypothetical protein
LCHNPTPIAAPDPSTFKTAKRALRIASDRVRDLEQRIGWHVGRADDDELVGRLRADLRQAREVELSAVYEFSRLNVARLRRRAVA